MITTVFNDVTKVVIYLFIYFYLPRHVVIETESVELKASGPLQPHPQMSNVIWKWETWQPNLSGNIDVNGTFLAQKSAAAAFVLAQCCNFVAT